MSNERQYYEDIGYKPFLFYVVFGVSGRWHVPIIRIISMVLSEAA